MKTEQKHTPGPWRQGARGPNGCPVVGTEHGLMVAMLAHSHHDHPEEAEANAHLIAAAPDLLAVLKEAADFWDSAADTDDRTAWIRILIDYHLPKMRAAIARAEGQS